MLQEASRPIRHAAASQSSDSLHWNFVGLSFFWREISVLPVLVIHISTQEPTFESVFSMSVLLLMQVIVYQTNVTKYMWNFPVCISTKYCQKRNGVSQKNNKKK